MSTIKITKKQHKQVDKIRGIIEKNRQKEDHLIATLVAEMGLNSEQEEVLWDYIYNNSDWMVDIEDEEQP
jgi:truncated hemoglobin YjbI